MYSRLEEIVLSNDYIRYLNYLGVDNKEILNEVKNRLEEAGLLSIFINRSYQMLSPNIILENIIFEEVNLFLYANNYDLNLFKKDVQVDIKTLIATQNSIIERPRINKPSEVAEGFKESLGRENDFVRIAKFENEMVLNDSGWGRKGQTLVFEGLTIFGKNHPFVNGMPSSLIWDNALFYTGRPFIVWFGKKINSIESSNVLWINTLLQEGLELFLDDFNHGLQALNSNQEVVLKFRQWRSDLVGNGSSFVGQNANIPKLEGCDLILREDYYKKLKATLTNTVFFSEVYRTPEI